MLAHPQNVLPSKGNDGGQANNSEWLQMVAHRHGLTKKGLKLLCLLGVLATTFLLMLVLLLVVMWHMKDQHENWLSEVRTSLEDIQARAKDRVASYGSGDQDLAPGDNKTSVHESNNHGMHTNKVKPRYCHDIYNQGERRDGVYEIYPGWNVTPQSVRVWCEFDVGYEVGWTIILARMPTDDPVNFSRGWDDYKAGFGDAHNEYWIGLSLLREIFLSHYSQVLHVNLESWDHTSRNAQYKDFSIGDEESGFKLSIGGYSGDAGDALAIHNGMKFTIKDKNNDRWGSQNCVTYNARGAFWHNNCGDSNPFGVLRKKGDGYGMRWIMSSGINLKKITFKISPRLALLI